jgi:hypothetical protein
LVQEKYGGEKACDKRHPYNNNNNSRNNTEIRLYVITVKLLYCRISSNVSATDPSRKLKTVVRVEYVAPVA